MLVPPPAAIVAAAISANAATDDVPEVVNNKPEELDNVSTSSAEADPDVSNQTVILAANDSIKSATEVEVNKKYSFKHIFYKNISLIRYLFRPQTLSPQLPQLQRSKNQKSL